MMSSNNGIQVYYRELQKPTAGTLADIEWMKNLIVICKVMLLWI